MKIKYLKALDAKADLLVVPFLSEDLKKMPTIFNPKIKDFLKARSAKKSFKPEFLDSFSSFLEDKKMPEKILAIFGGDRKDFETTQALVLGGAIGNQIKSHKAKKITLVVGPHFEKHLSALVEAIISAKYKFLRKNKSNKKEEETALNIFVKKADKELKKEVDKALTISEAQKIVKDLVNGPPNEVNSDHMEKTAKTLAKKHGLKFKSYGKKQLEKMKAGGILAVNQGCQRDPKLIILSYFGAKSKKEKPIILVGKGVIFDAGGYNIKPSGHIELMHQDMAGAATVMGVMRTLKDLKVKKNVIALMPCVENLVNEDAYRPSDIITMLSKHTVEITNTDAEGRMILADSLFFGSEMKPEVMISIATLTGAVEVAVGHRYCGVMANDAEVAKKLVEAGEKVDELAWHLPIHEDYRKEMKSKIADLRNHNRGSRGAGSSKAAAFLENFVGDQKWGHLDIGGTAFTKDPKKYQTAGATSHGMKLLLEFILQS
jgi:leucyl aminopeptidase